MQKSYTKFIGLSGLPRTGSTLLSAILCQNPSIHAEGNSGVCQIMWDIQESAHEQIAASCRQKTLQELIQSVPKIYYSDIESTEHIIVDKCRSWTMPANMELFRNYIDSSPKIIVLYRPIIEIVNSFYKLYKKNGKEVNLNCLLEPGSEPIMRSLAGLLSARENNQMDNFLFLSYRELINDTENTMRKIYDFCELPYYIHDFENIRVKYAEDDAVYQLKGQHEIGNKIIQLPENIDLEPDLPVDIIKKCLDIDTEYQLQS